jgi:hypothetical protein
MRETRERSVNATAAGLPDFRGWFLSCPGEFGQFLQSKAL